MDIQPEIIYAAIAALSAAIVALWRKMSCMWKKIQKQEEDCRKELNDLWRKIIDYKMSRFSECDLRDDALENWPDRREGNERRNKIHHHAPHHPERRSRRDRREPL